MNGIIDGTLMLCAPRRLLAHSLGARGRSRTLSSFISQSGAGLSPVETFRAAISKGIINEDPHQTAALQHLERLHQELIDFAPPEPTPPPPVGSSAGGTGSRKSDGGDGLWSSFTSMFGSSGGGSDGGSGVTKVGQSYVLPDLTGVPRGLYMYGGVGVGKSLLMDTFCDCAPLPEEKKRRVHFHEFMLEVHKRMHLLRQANPELGDPVPTIAYDISCSTQLLCFDEFQAPRGAFNCTLCRRRALARFLLLQLIGGRARGERSHAHRPPPGSRTRPLPLAHR